MKYSLAGVLFFSAVLARAEGDPGWRVCKADSEKFCPGSSNPGMCLHEHWDEISAECRSYKEQMKKRWEKGHKSDGKSWMERARAACGPDLEKHCPDTKDPGGCLHAHLDELSESCRAFKTGGAAPKHEKKRKML